MDKLDKLCGHDIKPPYGAKDWSLKATYSGVPRTARSAARGRSPNWQLSKQGIHWPVSPERTAGLKCRPIEVEYFLEVIRWQITSFKWSQAKVYFFQWFISHMLCLCHYGPALLGLRFLTELGRKNSAAFSLKKYKRRRSFLTMVTRWSRSTSNFYALIGQNLTGEFMRKLFTLTAEAGRVLCQLVMFLTVFFHWMYKMKYSCYQECSLIHGWFVYWVFGWEMCRLSKFGNPISDGIVFVFHLA